MDYTNDNNLDPNNTNQNPNNNPSTSGIKGEGWTESVSSVAYSHESAPVENESQLNIEKEPNYEKQRQQETPKPEEEQPQQPLLTKTSPAPEPKPNIVDKSKEMTKLHHIGNTLDKITQRADEEEEKFITEVEAAHERK